MRKRAEKRLSQTKTIYEMQAEICSALAHPIRIQVLEILSNGEKTVGDLLEVLQVPKANLSQHLSVLKDVGVIQTRKEGLYHYMSLSIPKIKDACSIIRTVLIEKVANEEKKNIEIIRELKAQR